MKNSYLLGVICAASLMISPVGYAATISYDLAEVAADPLWKKTGAGSISGNTINNDLVITRTTWPIGGSNDFTLGAVVSSTLPGTPVEAGARLFVRAHFDDLLNPSQYQEIQIRLMRAASDADNYIGLFNKDSVLLAQIMLRWDQTTPRYRIELKRQGNEILMEAAPSDALDFDAVAQIVAVALNTTNFPTLLGPANRQELGFGNVLPVGNMPSSWESIEISTAETPLPAALPLFATGLGVIGLSARRRKRKAAAALTA